MLPQAGSKWEAWEEGQALRTAKPLVQLKSFLTHLMMAKSKKTLFLQAKLIYEGPPWWSPG